jgi:hypothetical protein
MFLFLPYTARANAAAQRCDQYRANHMDYHSLGYASTLAQCLSGGKAVSYSLGKVTLKK